jgi:phosphonate transport system substrate-binding protein
MVDRRQFIKGAGVVGTIALTTGLSGCSSDGGGDNTTTGGTAGDAGGTTKLTFTLTPAEADVDVEAQYQGMFDYLENEADVTIESSVAADYPAVFESLESGRTHLADASPTLAVVGGNEGVTDVVGIRVAYGAAKYFSLITTTPDSGINKLADLEGKSVAFADKLSTSGSLFPLTMLKNAGLDIGDAPKGQPEDFEGKWSDHASAVASMTDRDDIHAAGTGAFVVTDNIPKDQFSDQFAEISAEYDGAGEKTSEYELQLLAESDPIPRAPILARSNWDSDVREDIEQALLNAEPDDLKGGDAEEEIWFTGLQEGAQEDYKPVETVKNNLGLEFGN